MELNEQQKQVAADLEHNILMLAPAGTGKTNTLACRIEHILAEERAMPEEILCLTFTNKACREMQERIKQQAGDAGARVLIKTFHSFCYDIIKTEAKRHSDLFADFTIFDEADCQALLRDIAGDYPLRALQQLASQLKEWRARYELYTDDAEEDYRQTLRRLTREQPKTVQALAVDGRYQFDRTFYDAWQEKGPCWTASYDRRLHDVHGLDFTDLIVQAKVLLEQPSIAIKWTRRFAYIHIDEVQDTSELEYDILSHIFGSSRLLLCGDYFQTIYEWRGSHPEVVLRRFIENWHPRRISLRENYRSTQVLLNASFAWLQHLFPERVAAFYPQGLEAVSREHGAAIVLKGAMDFTDEAQWIYYTIQQLPSEAYDKVCILTRSNSYNKALSGQFLSLGRQLPPGERLPFMLIDEMKFFRRQEVKDVLAFLKLIVNPHDIASFVRLLNRFGRGIGPAAIREISSQRYREAGLRLTDFLDEDARRTGDFFAVLGRAMAEENVVVFDVEATGVDVTRDEIIEIAGLRLGRDGSVKETFKRFLLPTRSVGESEAVHGISDEWLQQHGSRPEDVLKDFCAFAEGSVIVGHNVTYDLRILGSHLSRLQLPPLSYRRYYDTLDIFRRFYPGLPNHKLDFLSDYCGVAHKPSHDALADVEATADILLYAWHKAIAPHEWDRRQYMARWQEKFDTLAAKLETFRRSSGELRPYQLIGKIVVEMGMDLYYRERGELPRLENLRELYRRAHDADDEEVRPLDALLRFLSEASLTTTDLDLRSKKVEIPIITVHQAKGTEFDYVFLAGLQEGTFPGLQAERTGRLAEEARLFYVAITRPRKRLFLSWCQHQYGHERQMSRFVRALPRHDVQNV